MTGSGSTPSGTLPVLNNGIIGNQSTGLDSLQDQQRTKINSSPMRVRPDGIVQSVMQLTPGQGAVPQSKKGRNPHEFTNKSQNAKQFSQYAMQQNMISAQNVSGFLHIKTPPDESGVGKDSIINQTNINLTNCQLTIINNNHYYGTTSQPPQQPK